MRWHCHMLQQEPFGCICCQDAPFTSPIYDLTMLYMCMYGAIGRAVTERAGLVQHMYHYETGVIRLGIWGSRGTDSLLCGSIVSTQVVLIRGIEAWWHICMVHLHVFDPKVLQCVILPAPVGVPLLAR